MIIRKIHHSHFTIIGNAAIRDSVLSLKATGLLCYLLSLPQDWRISAKQIATAKKDGKAAIYSGMDELEKAGYVRRRHIQEKDGENVTETGKDRGSLHYVCEVTEVPFNFEPQPEPTIDMGNYHNDTNHQFSVVPKNGTTEKQDYRKPVRNEVRSLRSTDGTKDGEPRARVDASGVSPTVPVHGEPSPYDHRENAAIGDKNS